MEHSSSAAFAVSGRSKRTYRGNDPWATLPTTSVSHNTVVVLMYVGAWTTSEASAYVRTSRMVSEMLHALLPERVLAYNNRNSTAVR